MNSYQQFLCIYYIYIFSPSFKKKKYGINNRLFILLVKKSSFSCLISYLYIIPRYE